MKRAFSIAEELGDGLVSEAGSGLRWYREDFRVLYADTDRAGVVYHANYLKYFEIGRAGLIRVSGRSYKEIEAQGQFHPIVEFRVQFESYADYDDVLTVYARPQAVAPVKFSYEYIVRNDQTECLVVHGYTVHCCINSKRKVLPVDPVTQAIFADFAITDKRS